VFPAKSKKPAAEKVKPPADTATPSPEWLLHPAAPAGGIGPGGSESPQPLGFERSIESASTLPHPSAPESQLVDWTFGSLRRDKRRRNWILGAPRALQPVSAEPVDEVEPAANEDRTRSEKTKDFIRGTLSPEGIQAIKLLASDPQRGLALVQQDVLNKIGRYASVGDKSGVRRALLELTEQVDVSSPKDGAVLTARTGAESGSERPERETETLPEGKRSVHMTQGGQVFGALASILGKEKAFDWKDGLGAGARRLTERFGHEATGTVDVVVGARPATATAADAPVGAWTGAPPGGTPVAPAAPVGQWDAPARSGGSGGGDAPVGKWTSAAPGGGEPAPVGQWNVPKPGATGAEPVTPVGKWATPSDAVGKWQPATVPSGPDAPVGQWAAPAAPGGGAPAAGADAPVGAWNQPGHSAGGPSGAEAVGRWNAGGPPGEPKVGQWTAPGGSGPAAADARVGSWKVKAATDAALGQWQREGDLVIADGLNLSDLLRKNPNISDIRLVEIIQGTDAQPSPTLSAVDKVARSVLAQKFGFR